MRRLVLAAALALTLATPASAQQEAVAVGAAKLGERASAECRRAGAVGDERCHTGIGARVVRAEVAAHETSWLASALAFQRRLGDVLPLRDAPWVGTHNSFNATSEDPTLSHTDSNQQLSLVDQLRLGVRSLELDVHWVPSPRGAGFAPVLCHGQGPVGCSTERLLGDHLAEVDAWLQAHPAEVLLLYLEDQIDDAAGYRASAEVVRDELGDRLYAPRGTGCTPLPVDTLTRQDVRDAGAQVVVVGDCGTGDWQQVSHSWPASVRTESRPVRWSCAQVTQRQKVVRYFEDSTFLSRTPASSRDDGLTPATTAAMVRCGVDLLGFDQLLPRDGRLAATVWSWAEGEDVGAADAVQREDGRWVAVPATGVRPAACVRADGTFFVTPAVARDAAEAQCAARRGTLALPRTGEQNEALRTAGGAGAWLAV